MGQAAVDVVEKLVDGLQIGSRCGCGELFAGTGEFGVRVGNGGLIAWLGGGSVDSSLHPVGGSSEPIRHFSEPSGPLLLQRVVDFLGDVGGIDMVGDRLLGLGERRDHL